MTGAFIAMQSHPFAGRVFTCGRCRRACYHLIHVEDWACRKCQQRRYGLDYRSRHFHRTIPGFNRLIYLRRLISAGPPFSKIASRPQVLADRRRNPPVALLGSLAPAPWRASCIMPQTRIFKGADYLARHAHLFLSTLHPELRDQGSGPLGMRAASSRRLIATIGSLPKVSCSLR